MAPAPAETVWRLDRETDVKDLLRHLAPQPDAGAGPGPAADFGHGPADAMATVLALFQSAGPSERALLRPPELLDGLDIRGPIGSAVHAPRLVVAPGGVDH